ncbi:MAG TPA: putative metal-binding motif-containing protein [Myxococcaceae bacterium]|nr:putative metal-binding motif-containing protein [Myxococcaceae bacterium]
MKGRWSWLLWAAAAGATALGPGCTSASLVATVDAPATLKSTCVRVVALADGAEITSRLVALPAANNPLTVAIFEPQGQARPVTAVARGYVGANGCDEPLLLNDESAPVEAEFKLGSGGTATLALAPPPPAVDVDRDGYRQAAAGGPDCDDRRASVHPGAAEVCGDLIDNDCDTRTDCEQPSCINQACGGGRTCTPAGACEGRETQCTNGLDDDLDGLTDCLDPDCAGVTCDDGNPCTQQDRCQAGQCTGTPVMCNSPGGNTCLGNNGTCNPADGGCLYPSNAGQACGGSNVCDHDGGCGSLYAYTPSNFTPPAANTFVSLKFDCGGTATVDTTNPNANPWGGQLCGQTVFPTLIDRPQTGAGNAVIIPVENLYVASNMDLVVTGPRPAIFAVFGDAEIDGRLYASWGQGTSGNGMGVTTQCTSGIGGTGGAGTSGGGGGGGSFGTQGAAGGTGSTSAAGVPGLVSGVPTLIPLLGGCAGGAGGNAGGPGGGGGGGAVQISATESIIVRGAVAAPGGGGNGGQAHQTGGGGGGSGGAVLLEGRSVRVTTTGKVVANGGGGGEGDACCAAGTLDGAAGGVGAVGAVGGGGGGNNNVGWSVGGNGGTGAGGTQAATVGAAGAPLALPSITYQGGGGGGGGGLGRLRFNAARDCQLDGGAYSGTSSGNGTTGCQ